MTKKDLVKIIKAVVQREVESAVKTQISEMMDTTPPVKNYTQQLSLNDAINETATAAEPEWPTMQNFTSDMRSQFMAMNSNTPHTPAMTDINNRPVDTSKLDPSLSSALTRDYSELVKRFK